MKPAIIKIGGKSLKKDGESVFDGIRRVTRIISEFQKEYGKLICVLSAIGNDTKMLEDQARGVAVFPDPKMYDMLVSIGEQKSIALVGMALLDAGMSCMSLSGWQAGINTNSVYSKASIKSIDTVKIRGYLDECDILLIAGFQGMANDGGITTLGKGGSDTTAIALAISLGLDDCILLKDVRGIYTCDPKKIHTGELLPSITYDMLMETVSSGAEVVNAPAAELAKKHSQKLSIRYIDDFEKDGTCVFEGAVCKSFSIIVNESVAMISMVNIGNLPGRIYPVLKVLEDNLIKASYINQVLSDRGCATVVYLLQEKDQEKLEQVKHAIMKISDADQVIVDNCVATVSIVSEYLFGEAGIVYDLISVLDSSGIRIVGISTSEIKTTFILDESAALRCAELVYDHVLRRL